MGWSNTASSVLTANTVIVTASAAGTGVFVYSGTPGAGNLIATIAPAAGTDPFGNNYVRGVTSYTSTVFSQLDLGEVVLGHITGGAPDTIGAGRVLTGSPNLIAIVGAHFGSGVSQDPPDVILTAGDLGQTTGSATAPNVAFLDDKNSSQVDLRLSGSMIKTSVTGTNFTWQTPAYGTNWSSSTTFNGNSGYGPLQFRLDAENNLHIIGAFKAGAVAPVNPVFTLPAGYMPANVQPLWAQRNNAGTVTSGHLYVGSSGNVNVISGSGLGIAANNEYVCSGVIPLNVIP